MTALAGTRLVSAEGSTTTQGKYQKNINRAVDYLIEHSRTNGLIGDPTKDDRYTYGHGFSMLFLSQVLGEEEDEDRRANLVRVLTKAVEFSGQAQTDAGGWGYVSAKDGNDFDEGSTTITQVQGLRGCRNAGIPVPKEIIDKAIKYIRKCTLEDGGVQYSSKGGGGRPAISAAAIACLFNAGDYDDKYVPKMMSFAEKNLSNISNQSFGHWHYAHYYYLAGDVPRGGQRNGNRTATRSIRGSSRRDRRARRLLLDPRLRRPDLHHGHQPHDPATGKQQPADLSALTAPQAANACRMDAMSQCTRMSQSAPKLALRVSRVLSSSLATSH